MQIFGRVILGAKDSLAGYITMPVEVVDESFLSKGENPFQLTLVQTKNGTDIVEGTALELTEQELSIADNYEPDNYKRIKTVLRSGREAWIYVAQ